MILNYQREELNLVTGLYKNNKKAIEREQDRGVKMDSLWDASLEKEIKQLTQEYKMPLNDEKTIDSFL